MTTAVAYRLAAGVLIAAYAACAVPWSGGRLADSLLPAARFGLDQLQRFGWLGLAALVAAVGLARPLAGSIKLARVLGESARLATTASGGLVVVAAPAAKRSATTCESGAPPPRRTTPPAPPPPRWRV